MDGRVARVYAIVTDDLHLHDVQVKIGFKMKNTPPRSLIGSGEGFCCVSDCVANLLQIKKIYLDMCRFNIA